MQYYNTFCNANLIYPGCNDREGKSHYKAVVTGKAKALTTHHAGAWGERMYSSYSFTTSALDGGEWSASHPGRALAPGKGRPYPLYRRLGGPQSRSGHRG
jgi:hypothetical protein